MSELKEKMQQAVWIARSLYDRGKTSGSSANLSFVHDGSFYITASGSCFGNLMEADIVCVDENPAEGKAADRKTPSKEWRLHQALYLKKPEIKAIIHTHSTYAVLWSCMPEDQEIPCYTPYLEMKLGKVRRVGYAKPGSQELAQLLQKSVGSENGYLLANHGPLVGGKNLMEAYYSMEELEENYKIAWLLRNENANRLY